MNLRIWETTIQQIVDESNAEPKESGKQKDSEKEKDTKGNK